jgi:hypothetical protein
MKLLKRTLFTLSLVLTVFGPVASAQNINDELCLQNPSATFCQENSNTKNGTIDDNTIYGPNGIITKVIKLLSMVVGIAAVIMIIVGGIKYALSSGDPNNVNSAKNTIIYAAVGLSVAVLAQAIIIFVLNKL